MEVLYQVPPVGEITVICFFSAEGFIFQKPDGYLPAQAGSHILQAGQFSVRSYGYLIRSGGKWRIYRTFMCSGRNPGISKGKKIAGFGSLPDRKRIQSTGHVVSLFLMRTFKKRIGGSGSSSFLFICLQFRQQCLKYMLVLRGKQFITRAVFFSCCGEITFFPMGEVQKEFFRVHSPGMLTD